MIPSFQTEKGTPEEEKYDNRIFKIFVAIFVTVALVTAIILIFS